MKADLADLNASLAVAQARGFRDAARAIGSSASTLSEAVRRLEARLGVRLLHRSTRSVTPTEAGTRLIERLAPALGEVEAPLDVLNLFRDRSAGTLRLNAPVSAARLVLPPILPGFLAAYPDIRVEILAEDGFVDLVASGCDAGIRYDERLEQDMRSTAIVSSNASSGGSRHGPRGLLNVRLPPNDSRRPDWSSSRRLRPLSGRSLAS
jgi:DNA-binding transcriptional LysR family regulator